MATVIQDLYDRPDTENYRYNEKIFVLAASEICNSIDEIISEWFYDEKTNGWTTSIDTATKFTFKDALYNKALLTRSNRYRAYLGVESHLDEIYLINTYIYYDEDC